MADDKLHLSWEQVYDQSVHLADLIKQSGEVFDYMVVVPRGGYFPANVVARELGMGPEKMLHAGVGSYDTGEDNQADNLLVGEMPDPAKVKGSKLLVIDEVCDTGETLAFVVDYLKRNGATKVANGVLHYKPSRSKSGHKPDWSVDSTDQWIVYPWEEKEYTPNVLSEV